MLHKLSGLFALLILIFGVWLTFNFDQPQYEPDTNLPARQFSTDRAFKHVTEIGKAPHYLGSREHNIVRNYIVNELQEMGLVVQTQEDYILNDYGQIAKPQNIITRMQGTGNGNALILMTHYDSDPHSSYGASDAGSGVATILEATRALVASGQNHENDIILLFTDSEERGLLGAKLFVEEHPWAKDAHLALNFEARGSGGNSYMLLETNGKNSGLIEGFKNAKPEFPVANSLYYSIYKMLPNDTDLTVLRENGDITGFNFAFIDDHFDYHTANDIPERLDKETLAHQGSYVIPLLDYFKDADLSSIENDQDLVYFNLPFGYFVTYPFSWIVPMLILAIAIFIGLLIFGLSRKRLNLAEIGKGILASLLCVITSGILAWLLWKLISLLYPSYSEMINGFTYNGYQYILAFIFLSIAICFWMMQQFLKRSKPASRFVAPLLLWIAICSAVAIYLKGAAYFVIPVYFGLLQFALMIFLEKPSRILMAILCFPAFFLLLPFMYSLPVALGLKMLFATSILIALLFQLLIPVFSYNIRLKGLSGLSLLIATIFLIIAHFQSDFNEDRKKPNSLVYMLDTDDQKANWHSYDLRLDEFTSQIFNDTDEIGANGESSFSSKYGTNFTFSKEAPLLDLPSPYVSLEKTADSLGSANYLLKISSNRNANRIDLFELRDINFESFTVNGLEAEALDSEQENLHIFSNRWQEKLLNYYMTDRDTLRIEFSLKDENKPEFVMYESAYDLMQTEKLEIPERKSWMMPKPFVLNDATIIKKTIKVEE